MSPRYTAACVADAISEFLDADTSGYVEVADFERLVDTAVTRSEALCVHNPRMGEQEWGASVRERRIPAQGRQVPADLAISPRSTRGHGVHPQSGVSSPAVSPIRHHVPRRPSSSRSGVGAGSHRPVVHPVLTRALACKAQSSPTSRLADMEGKPAAHGPPRFDGLQAPLPRPPPRSSRRAADLSRDTHHLIKAAAGSGHDAREGTRYVTQSAEGMATGYVNRNVIVPAASDVLSWSELGILRGHLSGLLDEEHSFVSRRFCV